MSVLLGAVTTVATTPLPAPTPEVIIKTVQIAAQQVIPGNVLQLFQLFGLAAAGAVTSIVHLAIERRKLPSNVNRLLFTLYSTVAGVSVLFLTGQAKWDLTALVTGATAFLAFLGSTQGQKMLMDFASKLINNTTTDSSGVAVPLATDELPPIDAPA